MLEYRFNCLNSLARDFARLCICDHNLRQLQARLNCPPDARACKNWGMSPGEYYLALQLAIELKKKTQEF